MIGVEPNKPFLDQLLFKDSYQSRSIELIGEKRNKRNARERLVNTSIYRSMTVIRLTQMETKRN